MHVLLLCRDLMAMSSITSAVTQAGGTVRVVSSLNELATHTEPVTNIVLDLSAVSAADDLAQRLQEARRAAPAARIIAFGPHVQAGLLRHAQDAGCDAVLTRGQFMSQLPQLLGG
jgi:DNA-binding NarL/FixJ family response regulator